MKKYVVLSVLILLIGCTNFDTRGFSSEGVHRITKTIYDEKGFNKNGFDKDGYDEKGFNNLGVNKDGYDKNGYDKEGYDKEGFNTQGYTRDGYDRLGYDKNGYDKRGYDKFKRDVNGYSEAQLNLFKKFSLEPIDSFNLVINQMKESDNYVQQTRSEFESIEDYNKRINQERKKFRAENLKSDFIFVTGDNVDYTYDAEKKHLKIVLKDYEYEEKNFDKDYKYNLKNNNGNQVQISQVKREIRKYIIDNSNKEIYVAMSPEEAKEIKKNGVQVQLLIAPKYAQIEKIDYSTKYYETVDSFYSLSTKTYPCIAYKVASGNKELYKQAQFKSGYIAYDTFNERTKEYEPIIVQPDLETKNIDKTEYFRYKIVDGSLFGIKRIDDYYQEFEYIVERGFVPNNKKYTTWTEFYYGS